MSKLEQLIKELCPNGVEYVKLNSVCNIYDGTHQTPNYTTSGVQFVSVENIGNLYATEKYISEEDFNKYKIKPQINDVLMTRIGTIGTCAVVDRNTPLAYYVSLALLRPDTTKINSKYLKYYIESKHGRKELYKRTLVNAVPIKVNMGDIGKIIISIPPLEVQSEIVKVLDNFTELTANLTANLTADLTARKKQYEYYRDVLLSFDIKRETSNCEWRTVGELFDVRNGYTPSKSNAEYWENGTVPWFRMDDIRENGRILSSAMQTVTMEAVKNKPFSANSIIISTSATIGEHALITVDFMSNQRFTCLTLKKEYQNRYDMMFIFYYCFLLSKYCLENLNQSSFASVDMTKFYKFSFPLIPIEEQERIVSILDRFDKLCNDISESLLAEIEARRKQYEYYRDKLLSF